MTTAAAAAGSSASHAGTAALRRRKINNLAQSLGRMAHVKSKTVTWLKLHEKSSYSADQASTVSSRMVPSVLTLRLPSAPLLSSSTTPPFVLRSPLNAWAPEFVPPLPLSCSFCAQATDITSVTYNIMLPSPYVLCCASCASKK